MADGGGLSYGVLKQVVHFNMFSSSARRQSAFRAHLQPPTLQPQSHRHPVCARPVPEGNVTPVADDPPVLIEQKEGDEG